MSRMHELVVTGNKYALMCICVKGGRLSCACENDFGIDMVTAGVAECVHRQNCLDGAEIIQRESRNDGIMPLE